MRRVVSPSSTRGRRRRHRRTPCSRPSCRWLARWRCACSLTRKSGAPRSPRSRAARGDSKRRCKASRSHRGGRHGWAAGRWRSVLDVARPEPPVNPTFETLAGQLAEVGRHCYERGWALGTSGNFSAVVRKEPLTLAITTSGVDKGLLEASHIVAVDDHGRVVQGSGRPSAEATLHPAIVRSRGAGAVLHTHSVWSTILSEATAGGSLTIEGYEMLKGLDGVGTHEHRERLPIVENTQDWSAAAPRIETILREHPEAHGFLIRGHGLYTWGKDLADAKRQIEILEFLFEVMGRKRGLAWQQ